MNAQSETFEEEYEEYDEYEDEEDGEDRGLSGLVVLLMGVVMLGAFASIVWIAYQQGIKTGVANGNVPTVVADPEPLKIENTIADATKVEEERPVYDQFDKTGDDKVEVLAEGPEEPVTRTSDDPIAAIVGADKPEVVDDAVADRIASLAAADAAREEAAIAPKPSTVAPKPVETAPKPAATAPSTASTSTPAVTPTVTGGTHVVQVGAFRSNEEAMGMWKRMQGKLGDYLSGKSPDIEVADLGDKGVYHRLRVGPFSSSDDAKTYCEGLKSRGQDCLVKAK